MVLLKILFWILVAKSCIIFFSCSSSFCSSQFLWKAPSSPTLAVVVDFLLAQTQILGYFTSQDTNSLRQMRVPEWALNYFCDTFAGTSALLLVVYSLGTLILNLVVCRPVWLTSFPSRQALPIFQMKILTSALPFFCVSLTFLSFPGSAAGFIILTLTHSYFLFWNIQWKSLQIYRDLFVLAKSNEISMVIQFGDILLSSALLSNVLVKALPFLNRSFVQMQCILCNSEVKISFKWGGSELAS